MKTRNVKALLNKSGGERGGSLMTRVTIPADWARDLGIDEDDRNLRLSFDGETITINKGENKMGKAETVKMNKIIFLDEESGKTFKEYTHLELDKYLERNGSPFSKKQYQVIEGIEVYPYKSVKANDISQLINFRSESKNKPYELYATYEEIEEMLEGGYTIQVRGCGEIDSIEDLA